MLIHVSDPWYIYIYIYTFYIVFKNSDACRTVSTLYAMYNQFALYKSVSFYFPQNWSSKSTFEFRCIGILKLWMEHNPVCLFTLLPTLSIYICRQYFTITLHQKIEQLTYLYGIAKVMRIISRYCDGTFKFVWFLNGILWYFQSTVV